MKNTGFTLVELSIVLVIIGLLIGGILVGQSLIESAKLQGVVRQLATYEIMISDFKLKYKQLPGDTNIFPGSVGNASGLIGNYSIDTWNQSALEIGSVWNQLSVAEGLKTASGANYGTFNATGNQSAANCPNLKINQSQYANNAPTHRACLLVRQNTPRNGHIFMYGVYASMQYGNTPVYDPLTTADMLAIDQKIDDGTPAGGKTTAATIGTSSTAQCNNGSNAYNTATKDYVCTAYFGMQNI